jgi:hypothetical protein
MHQHCAGCLSGYSRTAGMWLIDVTAVAKWKRIPAKIEEG